MSLNKGVIPAERDDDLFIGWAKAPAIDRRFLFSAAPLLLGATTGLGWLVAKNLSDPGAGKWDTTATHVIEGALSAKPYPMIRVADPSAPFGMRTVLVVAQGKCTSGLDLAAKEGIPVKASGALIERNGRQMLEVPFSLDKWLEPVFIDMPGVVADPPEERLGRFALAGRIMDSKCFFGVMRPGRGKTHKACAALCIRGGVPPSFWARDGKGRESVLLMTDAAGGPLGEDILPLVADPVSADGEIVRVGDLLQFRADADAYRRV
ncbi:MAG: hypothetical protein KDE05_02025 [Parvularculaceae bacterium]|nr:hypothetical protein [Parvularculaceae bacterium]